MRKMIWGMAIAALLAGVYWSIGHGQVHPDSPVGKCLSWLHPKAATSQAAEPVAPCCRTEEPPLYVQAGKPVAVISFQPEFQPMGDAEGNEIAVAITSRTEPVPEVAVPSEEVRLMPGVEDDPAPVEKPRGELKVGFKLGCPCQLVCELKCESCCKMLTFSGMYAYLCEKTCGKDSCPLAACLKKMAPCCPACCKGCKPEAIAEPPVAVEESEPPVKPTPKPISWLDFGRYLPRIGVDTMEARPSDVTPGKVRPSPY
jgi:hypothetical protein